MNSYTNMSGAGFPGTVPPGAGFPGIGQPGIGLPGMAYPGIGPPEAGFPGAVPPGTVPPGTMPPGAAPQGAGFPGAGLPGAVLPRIAAYAEVRGGPLAPQIRGMVWFMDVQGGTWVCANIAGLPAYRPAKGNEKPIGPHGFHIHNNGNCDIGNPNNPFLGAGEHWNPTNQPHGNHAGDFPVLFSNNGAARMCFFTNKFKPEQAIGKAIIIHQNPDDNQSQPAGNAGKRLACGVIRGRTGA